MLVGVAHAANSQGFQLAAQLLSAARNGNIPMVERLVNGGADVNYTDGTGLSIVCTAIMNNDMKAAQILQVYGADASRCDSQIRRYKNKLPKENSGGLFSGLSNTQNLTLAAGGAALVVGGVYLLGDSFFGGGNDGNDSNSSGGSGDRPNTGSSSGGGSGGTATPDASMSIPYGPAEWDFATGKQKDNVGTPGYAARLATNMNVYSGAASNIKDFAYMNNKVVDGTQQGIAQNYMFLMGGYAGLARGYNGQITPRTNNNAPFRNPSAPLNSNLAPISVALVTANGVNPAGTADDDWEIAYCQNTADTTCSQKATRYKNGKIGAETSGYDLSGAGSAFNSSALSLDSLLVKIVVGGGDHTDPDFIGFMPNGQLALYRTGGGKKYKTDLGAFTRVDASNVKIGGTTYTLGGDGYYYKSGDTTAYGLQNNNLWEMEAQAYKNFEAMKFALGGSPIIANAAIPKNMKGASVEGIGMVASPTNASGKISVLLTLIDYYYYNNAAADGSTFSNPDPTTFLNQASLPTGPLVIFSAGEYQTGLGYGTNTLFATFDNAAPIAFANLEHRFMTAAAVSLQGGTGSYNNASDAPAYGTNKKYTLSSYSTGNDKYAARACGMAGLGYEGVDPWCFAAAGTTGEQAVAALAGAAGLIKGAFSYMTLEQIFKLMALTADGKYYNPQELNNMYQLPADLLAEANLPAASDTNYWTEWKKLFNKVFGYGMANIERATRPGQQLYFYSSDKKTSAGYWSATPAANRAATVFMPSAAFGGRAATISTPMFDFVENADGTESMPRVFDFTVDFGGETHGLNLNNLLGEISFDEPESDEKIKFQLDDNGREIKNLEWKSNNFAVQYKKNGGAGTFVNDNPLAFAGNVLTTSVENSISGFVFRISAAAGSVTNDGLLEHDPALANAFTPAKLGNIYGFDSSVQIGALRFGAGYVDEDKTTLGAYSGGLLDFGGGKTTYASAEAKLGAFTARYAAARTETNPGFGFIDSMTELYSDAYSLGADFGKWSFNISRPLAIMDGKLKYMHTNYELVETPEGYGLESGAEMHELNLAPKRRETRLAVAYQPTISDRTKLAFGLIERINPNNTSGHEEILLMKFRHIW
ncbi:MAG: ankyrin repeat domain-containing protein [Rickettsiales bacterium]|nr:ankyrin repeat domain-containing protein [Rickettsiales bacterium]